MAGRTREVWGGDDAAVLVHFDEHGRVVDKQWIDAPDDFWEWLRGVRSTVLSYIH